MSRRWLVIVSVTAHLCILAGVFVSGIWRLERLEAAPRKFDLAVQTPPPPPAPAGGSTVPRPLDFKPLVATHTAHGPRQPLPQADALPVAPTPGSGSGSGSGDAASPGTCTENCTPGGPPVEPVCGNGSVEAGEQCDDGNTTGGDGCSATCRIEVRPPPRVPSVAPSVLAGLRISGDTQVHPDETTQRQMIRDNASRVVAVVKLCIGPDGSVSSTHLQIPTHYPAYDAALVAAVAGWRYQPYRIDGTPVAACSAVRFVYTMQ